jgi:hypothetical protein
MLGRFGNNLFQYALGRVLAEKHGVPLVMDGSWFNAEGWRQVSCIRRLPIRARVVRPLSLASRALRKATGKHHWECIGKPVYREPADDQSYNPAVFEMPGDCVLMGYFQSPLFFQGIEPLLREELDTDALVWPDAVRDDAEMLRGERTVAVHVRRTDFTWLPNFGVCDTAYYAHAMEAMRERVPGARFFIFSDDPSWCREHFTAMDQTVICHAGAECDPLIDFHLMKQASHHIIANSSYSWWAAWLGKKQGQIVLCPPKWFTGGINAPIKEKLCEGWRAL